MTRIRLAYVQSFFDKKTGTVFPPRWLSAHSSSRHPGLA
jgi:hypothetical protein